MKSDGMQKVAIVGLGIEGIANLEHWKKRNCEITVFDENPKSKEIAHSFGVQFENDLKKIPKDALLVRTPGISPHKLSTLTSAKIWSGTNEFMKQVRKIGGVCVIGVTGTKGKGTTCSLIFEILRALGKNAHLLGNIGVPALSVLPKIKSGDFVVFEMSSFQLWDLEKGNEPDFALLTNLEVDHLDLHENFDDYRKAKMRIFNSENQVLESEYENSAIEEIAKSVQLIGKHNLQNAKMAVGTVLKALNLHAENLSIQQKSAIKKALSQFDGLPHRLKKVNEKKISNLENKVIEFFDDSIATTPGSAKAAIEAIKTPKILLLGGKDKGADYSELIVPIQNGKVEKVILFGENREKIASQLINGGNARVSSNKILITNSQNMSEIVKLSAKEAEKIDSEKVAVILSPAASSFDMFKNYSDRGDQFIEAAQNLSANLSSNLSGNTKRRKLLIFDSGKGGEIVAQKLKKLRPDDDFEVINDSKNVPYGSKTAKEVIDLTTAKIQPFIGKVDVIVIACNTATALAIDSLREKFPNQLFVGFEPMLKPAATKSSTKSIAVLATPATLLSARYAALKKKFASDFKVFEPDCSSWAEKIENAAFEKSDLRELKALVESENIDQVILACTHYLNIESEIRSSLPPSVRILQPLSAINRRISQLLSAIN